jgi:nucleoside diphosphate kinase
MTGLIYNVVIRFTENGIQGYTIVPVSSKELVEHFIEELDKTFLYDNVEVIASRIDPHLIPSSSEFIH